MDEKKICFIICSNNKDYLSECQLYIKRLLSPPDYSTEILVVEEATSMTSGYNSAMLQSNAKYKIYLHQDVFITDLYFLFELIDIFKLDSKIGIIGMTGTPKLPASGIMWQGPRYYSQYTIGNLDINQCYNRAVVNTNSILEVDAVDGFLIATQYDIPWRSDIFDGWDFYDISQCYEFKKRDYKIVVPNLKKPMCVHDDDYILNLECYDKYRIVFLNEYINTK